MSRQETQDRVEAVGTIHDVVGAMRAIAAGRIQGAQRALEAAAAYEAVVARTLQIVLGEQPELPAPPNPAGPVLLLVLTSEQPLCGTFNQSVIDLAETRRKELTQAGPVQLAVVGQRGQRLLAARNITPSLTESAATSLHGLRDVVKCLSAAIDHRYATGVIGSLHVIYNRYQSVSEHIPTEAILLPLSPALAAAGPHRPFDTYLPRPELLAGLISEYVFIRLERIAAESFVCEQASRLLAMDAATRNTEEMLTTLQALERRERQDEITREVLEQVTARFGSSSFGGPDASEIR